MHLLLVMKKRHSPDFFKDVSFHVKFGNMRCCDLSIKVQLFWEGHKNVRNRSYGFEIYLVNVKTMRTIAHNFVAFSEKLNFNYFLRRFFTPTNKLNNSK